MVHMCGLCCSCAAAPRVQLSDATPGPWHSDAAAAADGGSGTLPPHMGPMAAQVTSNTRQALAGGAPTVVRVDSNGLNAAAMSAALLELSALGSGASSISSVGCTDVPPHLRSQRFKLRQHHSGRSFRMLQARLSGGGGSASAPRSAASAPSTSSLLPPRARSAGGSGTWSRSGSGAAQQPLQQCDTITAFPHSPEGAGGGHAQQASTEVQPAAADTPAATTSRQRSQPPPPAAAAAVTVVCRWLSVTLQSPFACLEYQRSIAAMLAGRPLAVG
jgi:hypothetical protein